MYAVSQMGGYKEYNKAMQFMGKLMFDLFREKHSDKLWSQVHFLNATLDSQVTICGITKVSYTGSLISDKARIYFVARFEVSGGLWTLAYFGDDLSK